MFLSVQRHIYRRMLTFLQTDVELGRVRQQEDEELQQQNEDLQQEDETTIEKEEQDKNMDKSSNA